MVKQTAVHLNHEILLKNTKEQTIGTDNNRWLSRELCRMEKTSVLRDYVQYDST